MEYAQARMQARYGERADEALWRRLGGQASLAAYLAAARATPLNRWLGGIGERANTHVIEQALRERWRETVMELARWMPLEWQPAVQRCAQLVDLPALAWLAAGRAPWAWMERDAVLAHGLVRGSSASRAAWHADWRRCWPAGADADELERLAGRVEAHLVSFARAAPAEAPAARRALGGEAARGFRRLAFRPPAAFAYLLLRALELERLRGELAVRAMQWESRQ
ncbi:hypothetical protein LLG90_11455 [Aromatoleum toluclasticum]|uniref:hypothetical protein n=1 Tax=Aromatoleum toluclasticum TaxID=92003 RepID=UPI001D18D8A4|nr:hypothetical protein [Aromatoleum toluclasticum]MCC4115965.1 hypothetical protein [Aromatoleum toluclasticum]